MSHQPILSTVALLAGLVVLPGFLPARQQTTQITNSFEQASRTIEQQLEEAIGQLDAVRKQIEQEKLPLSERLNDAEFERMRARGELRDIQATLDSRTQDLLTLKTEVDRRQSESDYLADLLADYIRNLEAGLHIAELQLYEELLQAAKDAAESPDVPRAEVFEKQAALVEASIARLEQEVGGRRFEGRAVDAGGIRERGMFVKLGPAVIFSGGADGEDVGTAEQRVGSLQASVIAFDDPLDVEAARNLAATGRGSFPLDPTLGDAHKIAATQETFLEHVEKGGPVMVPIFVMAGLAALVALFKWIGLSTQRRPSRKQLRRLLDAVADGDEDAARARAESLRGPTGRMLAAGVEHLREPRELVEEVMYEHLLTTKLRLNRFLPFIAICAASAPLLGLLGTVTGIINTFKLLTVYGSGDVKALSGGISEALITTKFGLIVAIPSLLLHAFLSRKARGITGDMEQAAVALTNQLTLTPFKRSRRVASEEPASSSAPDPELVKAQVSEILGELLGTTANGSSHAGDVKR